LGQNSKEDEEKEDNVEQEGSRQHDQAPKHVNPPDPSSQLQEIGEELWDTFVLRSAWDDSPTMAALPPKEDYDEMYTRSLTVLKKSRLFRSVQWLEENGVCADTMHSRDSTIREKSAQLAMELVVLRDIDAGEEIFLDYGNEWEAAWKKHVEEWEPVEGADSYVSAFEMNLQYDHVFRTEFEQMKNPYPSNLMLKFQSRESTTCMVTKASRTLQTCVHQMPSVTIFGSPMAFSEKWKNLESEEEL